MHNTHENSVIISFREYNFLKNDYFNTFSYNKTFMLEIITLYTLNIDKISSYIYR